MRTAEDTLYEEVVLAFPHIDREAFQKSIIQGGLIEASMKAMKTYAKERVEKAADVASESVSGTVGDLVAKGLKEKILNETKIN